MVKLTNKQIEEVKELMSKGEKIKKYLEDNKFKFTIEDIRSIFKRMQATYGVDEMEKLAKKIRVSSDLREKGPSKRVKNMDNNIRRVLGRIKDIDTLREMKNMLQDKLVLCEIKELEINNSSNSEVAPAVEGEIQEEKE